MKIDIFTSPSLPVIKYYRKIEIDMSPTKLLYLEDFNLLNFEARILDVLEENGRSVIVLDQTYFYPQGGGQPQYPYKLKNIRIYSMKIYFAAHVTTKDNEAKIYQYT